MPKRVGKILANRDANQAAIIEALEKVGCTVIDAAPLGRGFPDLIVGKLGTTYLIEVKNPAAGGKLSKKQHEFFHWWNGHRDVAYSVEDALRIVGVV